MYPLKIVLFFCFCVYATELTAEQLAKEKELTKKLTDSRIKKFLNAMEIVFKMDPRSKEYLHSMWVALKAISLRIMLNVKTSQDNNFD